MAKKKDGRSQGEGRPEKQVDWDLVDELLLAGCMGSEIAPHFDMHHDTFYRKVEERYKISFTAYSQQKKSQGEAILRHTQYRKAIGETDKGDNVLLIWLGKNRLMQKETTEVSVAPETTQAFKTMMNQIGQMQNDRKQGQEQKVDETLSDQRLHSSSNEHEI